MFIVCLSKKSTFIIEAIIRTLTPLPVTRIACVIKVSVKVVEQGSENCISMDFYRYDLLYLINTIYRKPHFLCVWVCASMII